MLTLAAPLGFGDYQARAAATAVYPGRGANVRYVLLGLVSEVGEVLGALKKAERDDGGALTADRRARLSGELGDVMWYVAQLCTELGVALEALLGEAQVDTFAAVAVVCRRAEDAEHTPGDRLERRALLLAEAAGHVAGVRVELLDHGIAPDPELFEGPLKGVVTGVALLCDALGLRLADVMAANLEKLAARAAAGTLKGDGDDR